MFMFNDLLIVCNQGGGPYKHTPGGASVSALGGSPPANARGGGVHKSRVYLYTNTSLLTFSALANEDQYDAVASPDNAGSISINKGDGYIINGFLSGGDFAVVSKIAASSGGKEGALYVMFGTSPFDFTVRKIASVGATGQEGMVQYDNFVAVSTERGVYGIQGRNVFKLSDNIGPDYDPITNKGTSALARYKTQLRCAFPLTGTANNRELVLDVERMVWGFNTGKTPRVYTNHPDGRLLWGGSGSTILVYEDESGTNDDSAAINYYHETPDFSFGEPSAPKRLSSTHLHAKNTGSYNVTVERYTDGTSGSEAQTMNVSTAKPVKAFMHKDTTGKFHRMRFTNNTADQDITLYGYTSFAENYQPGAK
jgi:hypothetical protein